MDRYCLMSASDTQALLSPIESAPRIKYTCVATCQHYIALGANTGGVYCFHKDGYRYIRILTNQEGGVVLLRFSPSENALAVCCGKGNVSLWELNLTEQGNAKRVHLSTVLKGATITDMVWEGKSTRLFFGDDQGRLAVSYMPKKMFKKPDEIIHQEKPIVQMDLYQDLLLVSTVSRCVIFNVANREVVQVGKRSRDGSFGACFDVRWPQKPPMVYSARPGGRLWEADIKGTVVSTLRLKELVNSPATPLIGYRVAASDPAITPTLPLHFSALSILSGCYLACWGSGCLYLFHSASYQLAGWTEALGPQDEVWCDGQALWVLREGGRLLQVLQFVNVSTAIQQLVSLGLLQQAQQVLKECSEEVNMLLPSDPSLVKACHVVISAVEGPLSQQLLAMQEVTDALVEESPSDEESQANGSTINSVEVDGDTDQAAGGASLQNGIQVGGAGEPNDEPMQNGTLGIEDSGEGEDLVDGGSLPVGGVAGQMCDDEPMAVELFASEERGTEEMVGGDAEIAVVGGGSIGDSLDFSSTAPLLHSASGERIVDNADFPLGPALHSAPKGEPDLEEEEELASSHSNPSLDISHASSTLGETALTSPPSQSKTSPFSELLTAAAMETSMPPPQSKVIPMPTHHRTPDSTPSSSVGESLGQPFLGLDVVMPESNSLEGKSVHAALSRRKSWQPEGTSVGEEDDVVAVSVIVRSASSGSLGGKGKGKKKSKRKKTASPQPPQNQQLQVQPGDSNASTSPSALLYIPEEDLPFPEAGLPSSIQSSPLNSVGASPFPSLPSTPPKEIAMPPQTGSLPKENHSDRADSHSELLQKLEKTKTSRSSSIDISGAFSKVKSMALQGGQSVGQKVVKGFLSSLSTSSSSHDQPSANSTLLYRNSDVQYPPSATPTAGVISPASSVEQGEFAGMASPRSDNSDWLASPPSSPPPLPHHDTLAFTNTTVESCCGLESPVVLCSPEETCSLLSGWLCSLEEYMRKLESVCLLSEVPSLVSPPLPFSPLPPNALNSAIHLATLCAELAIYSGAELATVESGVTSDSERMNHGMTLAEIQQCDSLESFTERYAELLDLSRMRCLLAHQEWPVREKGWWALNRVKSASQSPQMSLNRSHPKSLTDRELLSLLTEPSCDPEDFLALAVAVFPRLLPWEVALVCNVDTGKSHDLGKGSQNRGLYVQYLSRLFSSAAPGFQEMINEVLSSDHTLLLLSLSVVLEETTMEYDYTHTEEGLPRHYTHSLQWTEHQCLERLLDMGVSLVAMGAKETGQKMLMICQDAGYWMGAIRLLQVMGDRTAAIKMILALGDIHLLTEPQPWGCILGHKEEWQLLINSVVAHAQDTGKKVTPTETLTTPTGPELRPNNIVDPGMDEATPTKCEVSSVWANQSEATVSEGCGSKERITRGDVLKLLVDRVPPAGVGRLANSSHLLEGEDTQTLLVATTSLHTQQRALAHSLLEKVDRYLWSPRPSTLGPHIYSTFNTEKDTDPAKEPAGQPLPPSAVPFALTLEEGGVHWGVKTSSSTCTLCRLPLTSRVSERSPGIITFFCGHAFHKSCVPEAACVQCFQDNLQTVSSLEPSPSHFLPLHH